MTRARLPGTTAAAAAAVGLIWLTGAVLPIGVDRPGLEFVVSDYVYSAMLASYAVIAWLATRLVPGRAWVRHFGWVLALAGLAGAVGNFLEDIVAVAGSEYLYGFGFFASLIGLVGLAVALLAARRPIEGGVVAATLVGVVAMAGGGPPMVPVIWLAVAAWASFWGTRRGERPRGVQG